jgi:uncharacterized protein DUF87/helicase HerA-like protein
LIKTLHLNAIFTLPLEAHTNTFGILAVRGAGKSNTAAVMAEEFFDAGLPFVVIDPVGSWWGLRSSGDGKGAGLAIPIFGGRHGDVPLERGGGELVADLVVEKRISCVLDLSEFASEGDKKYFLLAFARRLYGKNTEPLHLFLEEADDYIPQRPMRDEAQLLRAWENIVRRGRSRGLGMTIITQRSASVNKSVLTQIETLLAMRTTSPQDRAAIEEWVKYHGQSREILTSLSSLANGEAWVWSPHFLNVCERVQIRMRRTFDSGATPKHSAKPRPSAVMADIDLAAIAAQMKDTIERAEASDPKLLQRRIAELEQAKRKLEREIVETAGSKAIDETAIAGARENGRRSAELKYEARFAAIGKQLSDLAGTMGRVLAEILEAIRAEEFGAMDISTGLPWVADPTRFAKPATRAKSGLNAFPAKAAKAKLSQTEGYIQVIKDAARNATLPRPQQAILDALAWLEAIGLDRGKRTIVAFLAGASPNSSSFTNNLGALRTAGLIDYPASGAVALTAAGRDQASAIDTPQTPEALHEMIYSRLTGPQTRILRALIRVYPAVLTHKELADAAGASISSSSFTNNRGALRSLGLISYTGGGEVRAQPILFLESGAGRAGGA